MKPLVETLFRNSLKSICPRTLIESSLKNYPKTGQVHVIGFGKAAAGMVSGVVNTFGDHAVNSGIVSVPIGTYESMSENNRLDLWPTHERIKIFEVAKNNLPDEFSVRASQEILDFCTKLGQGN